MARMTRQAPMMMHPFSSSLIPKVSRTTPAVRETIRVSGEENHLNAMAFHFVVQCLSRNTQLCRCL